MLREGIQRYFMTAAAQFAIGTSLSRHPQPGLQIKAPFRSNFISKSQNEEVSKGIYTQVTLALA